MSGLAFLVLLFSMMAFAVVVPSEVRPQVLTLHEAADFLRVSERTLWELARANEVPHFKVRKQYRFLVSKLEAWATSPE